jgi:hypothetical protein
MTLSYPEDGVFNLAKIIINLPIKDPELLIRIGLAIAPKEMGRLGGLKGGPERARRLSPERRKEIAQKAARARWEKTEAP